MRKYYFGVIDPNYSTEYSIGGLVITVYHYFKKEGEKMKKTPLKKNIININDYEGKHHPSAKIDKYPNVTIDEDGVKDLTKGTTTLEDEEIQCKKDYLIGLIVVLLHALKIRVLSNIKYRLSGIILDPGHLKAPRIIGRKITKYVCMLKRLIPTKEYSQISNSLVPHFIYKKDIDIIYSKINIMTKKQLDDEYSKLIDNNKENNPIKKKLEY
jgi:hypothetical protein